MKSLLLPPLTNLTEGTANTPIAFIQAMIQAYQYYGVNPANALCIAQITPQQLNNPHSRVTAAQMEMMSAVAMQELDDEALGWFSRRLPWGTYGMLCRASLTASNLGIALKRWCRHHSLLTDDILLSLHLAPQSATLTIELKQVPTALQEFCLVTNFRYTLSYACWLIDSKIQLLRASFPHAEPEHHDVYTHLFAGAIEFNAPKAQLEFDARYLQLPIRRDERDLNQMLQRAIAVTVHPYRRDRLLIQQIRRIFQQDVSKNWTAELLAQHLHISLRSLHRHLQEEGASLQHLKDEARRHQAMQLLHRSHEPIKQIAQQVGFKNEKSFSRAFRSWTGLSPQHFRQQHE